MYLFRGDCLGLKDQHPGCGSLAAVSSQAGGHPALQFLLTPATLSGKQSSSNLLTAIRKNRIWTELRSRFKARQQENTNPPAATLVLASGFVCVRALKKCGKLTFSVMLDDDAKAWSLNLCAMVASTSSWLRLYGTSMILFDYRWYWRPLNL